MPQCFGTKKNGSRCENKHCCYTEPGGDEEVLDRCFIHRDEELDYDPGQSQVSARRDTRPQAVQDEPWSLFVGEQGHKEPNSPIGHHKDQSRQTGTSRIPRIISDSEDSNAYILARRPPRTAHTRAVPQRVEEHEKAASLNRHGGPDSMDFVYASDIACRQNNESLRTTAHDVWSLPTCSREAVIGKAFVDRTSATTQAIVDLIHSEAPIPYKDESTRHN